MSNISRVTGLLPAFNWLEGDNLLETFARCLLVTPGGMIIIGLIFEGRIVPLNPKKQYLAFMPGDIFLSAFCALLIWMPLKTSIPTSTWYTDRWFHLTVLLMCMIGAFIAHFAIEAQSYTLRSLNSPTKMYHDIVLYGMYSYVMCGVGVPKLLSGNLSGIRLLIFVPLLIWLMLAVADSTSSKIANQKREFAHPTDWQFSWKR